MSNNQYTAMELVERGFLKPRESSFFGSHEPAEGYVITESSLNEEYSIGAMTPRDNDDQLYQVYKLERVPVERREK